MQVYRLIETAASLTLAIRLRISDSLRRAAGDGQGGERWVYACGGDEDAGVADVEVRDIVRLAEFVDDRVARIAAHAAGAHRVGAVVQADSHLPRAGGRHHLGRFVAGGRCKL